MQIVEEHFDAVSDEPEWSPQYNIAPTQPVAAVHPPRTLNENREMTFPPC
jgi:putative SOS response-associated peptidase YedK